ncbi:hypothetical protein PAXRUDRAFT_154926, partial [Paxillus rubicundulus Ve08.2h10]
EQRASGSVAPSSDSDSGDEVHHTSWMTNVVPDLTPPPSYPVNWRSPPQSMPLEGENSGTSCKPQNRMDSPGSQPPSIGLKGEKCRWPSVGLEGERDQAMSPCAKVEDNQLKARKLPRGAVGTLDGDTHHPNKPTEPSDEREGGRGRDSEGTPTVENAEGIEAKGPSTCTNKPTEPPDEDEGAQGGKGKGEVKLSQVKGTESIEVNKSREIKGEARDKVKDDGGQ